MKALYSRTSDGLLPPVRSVQVDNDGLVDEVVAHTLVAAEMITGGIAFDGRAVHCLLIDEVRYDADDDIANQRLRMPWRTLNERRTDCKSSAIFIGALAKRSGERVCLRFIDEHGIGAFTHVYAVVNGTPIDPLEPYGAEMAHVLAHDVFLED